MSSRDKSNLERSSRFMKSTTSRRVGSEEQELNFSDCLARILKLFEYDACYCRITIGLSNRFSNIEDLGAAFDKVMTDITMQASKERFQIISSSDESQSGTFSYLTADEQRILNCLAASDLDGLGVVIRNVWSKNKEREATYRQMNQLFQEMHFTGVRFLEENGVSREQIRLKDENAALFNDFDVCTDIEQFENNLSEFFRTVIEIAKNRAPSKPNELAGMISEYIQAHFMQNLSLEQIADEMNVSVKYVSRVFKEKTGVNLTAYINQVRVEKAKELLVGTDLTINDVAFQVGIESRTTFLRVFKKLAGVAPHEYRIANKTKVQP